MHGNHNNRISITPRNYIVCQKRPTLLLFISWPNINRFSKHFTGTFSGIFAITRLSIIPPNFNCVATLPCEIQIVKNHYNQNK